MKYLIDGMGVRDSLPTGLRVSSDSLITGLSSNGYYIIVGRVMRDWEYEAVDSSIPLVREILNRIEEFLIEYRFGDIHLDYYWKNPSVSKGDPFFNSLNIASTELWYLQKQLDVTNFYCCGGYKKLEKLLCSIERFVQRINTFIKDTIIKNDDLHGNVEILNIPLLTIK